MNIYADATNDFKRAELKLFEDYIESNALNSDEETDDEKKE